MGTFDSFASLGCQGMISDQHSFQMCFMPFNVGHIHNFSICQGRTQQILTGQSPSGKFSGIFMINLKMPS